MSVSLSVLIQTYYSNYDSSKLLHQIQSEFGCSFERLSSITLFPLYKILNEDPHTSFNKTIANKVFSTLGNTITDCPNATINETAFEYFLMGYNAYFQLSESWRDFHNFNISQAIKTRMYRLPFYTSLLEGCLSNFLRFIASLLEQKTDKQYSSQTSLSNLIAMANANYMTEISDHINVNIRNAINHGKVVVKNGNPVDTVVFYYSVNHQAQCLELNYYQIDDEIDRAYDMISGLLLGILLFLNQNPSIINIKQAENTYAAFSLLAMQLSLPNIHCFNISNVNKDAQLNIEIAIDNPDRKFISQIAILISIIVYSTYDSYKKYWIGFSHPRMPTGWLSFRNEEIVAMIRDFSKAGQVISNLIERKDFLIFPPSEEEINIEDAKYFCFPNYSRGQIKVNSIHDASVNDRKRLKANLFIGDLDTREQILSAIEEAIDWLKTVRNPLSPTIQQKHGTMPADSLYVNVYRYDKRNKKIISPNNENFICFVDYNQTGKTTLLNGGFPVSVWNSLRKEKIDKTLIAWGKTQYLTVHASKTGRNDLCPCGSGKKYKKCCGRCDV